MARELEMKFSISNRSDFINKLENLGIELSNSFEQDDIIFLRHGKTFEDLQKGEAVIRIRKEKNIIKTTIKKYVKGILDRKEVECKISDIQSFQEFLNLLDFSPVVSVNKTRRKGIYHNATIVIDHVKELGDYIEIEIISEDHSVEDNLVKLKKLQKS